jgi:hypothetical protein
MVVRRELIYGTRAVNTTFSYLSDLTRSTCVQCLVLSLEHIHARRVFGCSC